MPMPNSVGSSPIRIAASSAHAADTGTSLSSDVSPASEQPGSSQSVWPSPSSSLSLSQGRPPGAGVAVGVGVGAGRAVPPPPGRGGAGGGGARVPC